MPCLQTNIYSDVGNELLSYAQQFEHNPPMVGRLELVAALRRLGQRCLAGVRRASCRHTTDVVVHATRLCLHHHLQSTDQEDVLVHPSTSRNRGFKS